MDSWGKNMLVGPTSSVMAPGRATSQATPVLLRLFQQVRADSCPRQFNFHLHTTCSDGKLAPGELVEQAIALGLKEFAITDHHTIAGYLQAKQCLEDWQWRHPARVRRGSRAAVALPRLWVGVEITAKLANTDVHILGYGFAPDHEAMALYLQGPTPQGADQQAERVIGAIQEAGGLAILAHPARYRRSPAELIPAAAALGMDGIETYYAYDNPLHWRPCPKRTPEVLSLTQQFSLLHTCGTDTHGTSITRRL